MNKESNSRLSVCQHRHLTQVWTQNMRNVFKEKKLLCGSVFMFGLMAKWLQQTRVLVAEWPQQTHVQTHVPGGRWYGLATLSRKPSAFDL